MANHAWVQGTRFYWVNRGKIYSIEGTATGIVDKDNSRAIWLEGPNLCYYDGSGNERKVQFSSMRTPDIDTSQILRAIWTPVGEYLEFRDAQGERRRLVHNDHSDDSHGNYNDYDDVSKYSDSVYRERAHLNQVGYPIDEPPIYGNYTERISYSKIPHENYDVYDKYDDYDDYDVYDEYHELYTEIYEKYDREPWSDDYHELYGDVHDDHDDYDDEPWDDKPWRDVW